VHWKAHLMMCALNTLNTIDHAKRGAVVVEVPVFWLPYLR